jgi:hypothetical protein
MDDDDVAALEARMQAILGFKVSPFLVCCSVVLHKLQCQGRPVASAASAVPPHSHMAAAQRRRT